MMEHQSARIGVFRLRLLALLILTAVMPFGMLSCDDDGEQRDDATPSPVASPVPTQPAIDQGIADQLQSALASAIESPHTPYPGVVLHVRGNGLGQWTGTAGFGDSQPQAPVRPDDKFRAGSILKPFISVVVLQLVEEGVLSLDDTLPEVLPEDVHSRFQGTDQITIRMLLNHTSGIPEWLTPAVNAEITTDPAKVWQTSEFLDAAAAQPQAFPPGAGWAYSNTDYTLLGAVIEQATGNSWRDEVNARLISPIGLDDTSLPEPGDPSMPQPYMHGYADIGGQTVDVSEADPSMADSAGGGALVTTVSDLTRFWQAVVAGDLFEQETTLDQMLTYVDAPAEGGQVGYGLGVERYLLPGGIEIIGHLGGTVGYRSIIGYLPAQDLFIATAMNMQEDPTPVLLPVLQILLGAP